MATTVDILDIWILVLFMGGTVAYGLWSGRRNRTTGVVSLSDYWINAPGEQSFLCLPSEATRAN